MMDIKEDLELIAIMLLIWTKIEQSRNISLYF